MKAVQADSQSDEKNVKDAPANCDNGTVIEPPASVEPPPVELTPLTGNYTILAANDLGMHCADQDFRIFSILPPYNVVNAQVLRKGGEPKMMSPLDGVHVTYKAVDSNYLIDLTDPTRLPDATDSFTSTGTSLPGIFKNNFWETVTGPGVSPTGLDTIGFIAYESLYPPGLLAMFDYSTPDLGLPAPDVALFYLLEPGTLEAEQSAMPGLANVPQPFHGFVEDFPFFVDFPFGCTVNNFKRYTAEGIPISAIDDSGRSNPYPLMRIEARDANDNVLASVDAVVPVASEADCQICHASQEVCNINNNNPNSNDNKAANDLQGHAGTIIECSTCHEGDLGDTLEGPHGMHPVGDTGFSDGGHEDLADQNNGDSCRACHGLNGEGSVLSRTATDRTLSNEGDTISLAKGEVITCSLCHDNELKP